MNLGRSVKFLPFLRMANKQSQHCCSTNENLEGVKWLWPADEESVIFDAYNKQGTRMGYFGLTLNSSKPIESQHLRQVSTLMQRKIPVLRYSLMPRGKALWFCEPPHQKYDPEVIEDDLKIEEVIERMVEAGYAYGAPHWKMAIIPRGPHVPCPIPEVKITHPYQCDLVFTFHHGMGDGLDGSIIVGYALHFINEIIDGKPIGEDGDDEDIGDFSDRSDVHKLMRIAQNKLANDSQRAGKVRRSLPSPDYIPLLLRAFPPPSGTDKPTTRHTFRVIESQVIKALKRKSKEAGLTFNSTLSAAINMAVMELAKDAGLVQDSYKVTSNHLTSLRKHVESSSRRKFGLYATMLSQSSEIPINVRQNFWNYAKEFHDNIRADLLDGVALEQQIIRRMHLPKVSFEELAKMSKPVVHDYGLSNLGDFSIGAETNAKALRLTKAISMNRVHNFVHSNLHQFLIFERQGYYTISYATNYITDNTANLFADKIVSILQEIATFSRL